MLLHRGHFAPRFISLHSSLMRPSWAFVWRCGPEVVAGDSRMDRQGGSKDGLP